MNDKLKERLIQLHGDTRGPIVVDETLLREQEEPSNAEEKPQAQVTQTSASRKKKKGKPARPSQPETQETDETPEKRGPGRPAHYPPWLQPAAQLVANGYTLRKALWRLGVSIPDKTLRQVYRWKLFREYYEEARRIFVTDWGCTPPKKAEGITRDILSMAEDMGIFR